MAAFQQIAMGTVAVFHVSAIMSEPQPPRDEAFKRLDQRLDALADSTRREPKRFDEAGTSEGYRVIGELLGGILGGLGLGAVLDRVAGTTPWGLIGGVLIGTGGSIFLVARNASRTAGSETKASQAPARNSADTKDDVPG